MPILDILIKNAVVFDGTGAESFAGDTGIRVDAIVSIGSSADDEEAPFRRRTE